MKSNFLTWEQAQTSSIFECGGKGCNLARLAHLGFKVPAGGILVGDVYQKFMNIPLLHSLMQCIKAIPDMELSSISAEQLLNQMQQAILTTHLPNEVHEQLSFFLAEQALNDTPVAVRSSATLEDSDVASFAGMHDSFLNVHGISEIEQSILKCFASLWTLKALSYRRKMKLDGESLHCAVIVMALVRAESSGVAFTCDPTTGREDVCVINANFGLGESVVNGVVQPDEYQLSLPYWHDFKQKIGSKSQRTMPVKNGGTCLVDSPNVKQEAVLSEDETRLLARLVDRVFWALGKGEQHQDIEWVFDGNIFYILQTRPITVLPRLGCDGLRNQADIWTNGNFRDACPWVFHTLAASVFPHQINGILHAPFISMSYPLPQGLNFTKLFQGRIYLNVSLMQWLYYDSLGLDPATTNRNIGGQQQEIMIDGNNRGFGMKKVNRVLNTIKLLWAMNKHKKQHNMRMKREVTFANQYLALDFKTLNNQEMIEHLELCNQRLEAYALPFMMLTSRSGSVSALFDVLLKYLPDTGTGLATALLAGAGDITSANQGYQLQALAALVEKDDDAKTFFSEKPFKAKRWYDLPRSSAFKQAFQKFIDEFGHRAVYEIYLHNPRWREDQTYLLNIIKQHIGVHNLNHAEHQQEKVDKAWLLVKKAVPFYMLPVVKSLVKQAADGSASKEMTKSVYVRLLEPLRLLYLDIGRRLVGQGLFTHGDDIFHCAYAEVVSLLKGEWAGEGLAGLIEARKIQQKTWEKISAPDVILGDEPQYSKPMQQDDNGTLKGLGVAAGCAEGTARLIYRPDEGTAFKHGDVLVAPSTDPAWTPLFLHASAIVMETGGQLSHGAIVAREYGIPAVVNIAGLFQVIQDGESITVDGSQGLVRKVK